MELKHAVEMVEKAKLEDPKLMYWLKADRCPLKLMSELLQKKEEGQGEEKKKKEDES